MKTFKNKAFKKRDYEATNIVFARAEKMPTEGEWVEVDEMELDVSGCSMVYGVGLCENRIDFYGWL